MIKILKLPTAISLVKKHNGWWEGKTAYFPSVYDREQFEKEWRVYEFEQERADEDECRHIHE